MTDRLIVVPVHSLPFKFPDDGSSGTCSDNMSIMSTLPGGTSITEPPSPVSAAFVAPLVVSIPARSGVTTFVAAFVEAGINRGNAESSGSPVGEHARDVAGTKATQSKPTVPDEPAAQDMSSFSTHFDSTASCAVESGNETVPTLVNRYPDDDGTEIGRPAAPTHA